MLIKRPWSEAAKLAKRIRSVVRRFSYTHGSGLQSLGLGCMLISLAPFWESNSLSL